jgi:hypothetical protein
MERIGAETPNLKLQRNSNNQKPKSEAIASGKSYTRAALAQRQASGQNLWSLVLEIFSGAWCLELGTLGQAHSTEDSEGPNLLA